MNGREKERRERREMKRCRLEVVGVSEAVRGNGVQMIGVQGGRAKAGVAICC